MLASVTKRLSLSLALATGLASALAGAACGGYCTEVACGSEQAIFVRLPAGFDATSFRLSVQLDDQTPLEFECTQSPSLACAPGVQGGVLPLSVEGEADLVDVRLVGGTPDSAGTITVSVSNDAGDAAAGSHAPDYVETRPNGPDCPPVCFQASSVELMLEPVAP